MFLIKFKLWSYAKRFKIIPVVGRKKGDAGPFQLAAHNLKSSSAHIGAIHLSALAKKLEMGRSGALDRTKEGAEKLLFLQMCLSHR